MQPSSSKERQHPSWLNAQTRCATEAGRCHLAGQTRHDTEVQAPPHTYRREGWLKEEIRKISLQM